MELPELSLAPRYDSVVNKSTNSSSSESESNPSRKRKFFSDHLLKTEKSIHTSVDLQLKDPLPLDWEQCLDLESGRMYYLNRKTLRKSCNWPKDQKLDLELHIATHSNNSCSEQYSSSSISSADALGDSKKKCSPSSNMMALPCLNCHLLVILSKSFPSCPNCKYVHLFPSQQSPPSRAPVVKSLNTLSLLN